VFPLKNIAELRTSSRRTLVLVCPETKEHAVRVVRTPIPD
jgi:hypothetical protein